MISITRFPKLIIDSFDESSIYESKNVTSTVKESDILIDQVADRKLKEVQEFKRSSDHSKSLPREAVSNKDIYEDRMKAIRKVIDKDSEKFARSHDIAKEINLSKGKIRLFELKLSKTEIQKIAPLLTHMNLRSYSFETDGWTTDEIQQLIESAAPNLVSLSICGTPAIPFLPKDLPKLEELDCRSSIFETLPICPELRTLDCSLSFKLTSLPQYPKLEKLICDQCSNLEEFPEYPKLSELRCESCYKLTAIPPQPQLRFLLCNSCNGLIELPTFPNLETLFCCYCENLSKLPDCPILKSLACMRCRKLTHLPSYPMLKKLSCSDCGKLTKLPLYSLLEALECRDCNGLTVLPNYKNLKTLNCCRCKNLTIVPLYQFLEDLDCRGCKGLTVLPDYEKLKKIICNSCKNLTNFPLSPHLEYAEYADCPRLINPPKNIETGKGFYCSFLSTYLDV